ncbi:amidohydrolase family protein [Luteolibacter marinus]|uniref:amidohydrolase family protein n=1 Tax=Luteolibacter marinus TaxID=2776705 RepID=UPI00186861BC|nr:amidohydrolase family protein [Luteolibacter marinus]
MIDAHHHLWRYSPEQYGWIPPGSPLAQDRLLPELDVALNGSGVTGTIAVQARQIVEETEFLLDLAEQEPRIRGVVGWVPLVDPGVDRILDRFTGHPAFRGVRHVLQDEPDDYFLRDDFHRGLALLPERGLSYDLLVFQRQIPVATRMIDRHPELPVILDHIAKPEARNGRIEKDWQRDMRELAKRDHLIGVKFSGLLTEFPPGEIDPATVRAYFEETLAIFGPARVMFGTDWPVCLLRIDAYAEWANTIRTLVSSLSPDEQNSLLEETASCCYGLDSP